MSEHSTISWTDATWPLVGGCDYVSPGCSNCWAVRDSWRMAHNPNPKIHTAYFGTVDKLESGKLVWSGVVRMLYNRLHWPLKWRKGRLIFVCSQSDLFHQKVSFEFIAAAFGVMAACPRHTFQVLTKHPARALQFFQWLAEQGHPPLETCLWHARQMVGRAFTDQAPFADNPPAWPLENVWFGVTVEDQKRADERINVLLRIPAVLRWLSVEPMLEAIKVSPWLKAVNCVSPDPHGRDQKVDLVVCGGESAQTRAVTRPFNVQWARELLAQCRAAGTLFHMKQLGTRPMVVGWDASTPTVEFDRPIGKSSRYKWHEPEYWPQDLRVQEMPA